VPAPAYSDGFRNSSDANDETLKVRSDAGLATLEAGGVADLSVCLPVRLNHQQFTRLAGASLEYL
jgi:hypothetical protein